MRQQIVTGCAMYAIEHDDVDKTSARLDRHRGARCAILHTDDIIDRRVFGRFQEVVQIEPVAHCKVSDVVDAACILLHVD